MTHDELVKYGYKWLIGAKMNCGFALREMQGAGGGEIPDVIGFRAFFSIVIECKVSRSDFLGDKKKPFRQKPETGMGGYRFFLIPKGSGIIKPEDLPENWGLLEASPTGRIYTVHSLMEGNFNWVRDAQPHSIEAEHQLMWTALRRLHLNHNKLESIYKLRPTKANTLQ